MMKTLECLGKDQLAKPERFFAVIGAHTGEIIGVATLGGVSGVYDEEPPGTRFVEIGEETYHSYDEWVLGGLIIDAILAKERLSYEDILEQTVAAAIRDSRDEDIY